MRNNYICALDLGSSKIACALAELKKGGVTENIFLESVPSKGIKKGRLIDIQEISASLDRLLEIVKKKSGRNIHFVYINIYGQDVSTRHSQATIPLAERGNKLITLSDVRRVTEEARILGSSLEEEIIQTIPFSYTVDDRDNITNPLGLYGHKLGVDLFLILVKSSYLQSIERLFNRLGYEIKHLFLSGLATSKVVLNKDSIKNGLYIFCDIGADLTEIVVFEDAILKHIETLIVGGDDLTEEIAQSFKIPFELAEEIKRSLAYVVDEGKTQEDKEVMIKKDGCYKPISQAKVREVLVSKTELICRSIKERLDEIVAKDKAINGIFVGGRTVLIGGFLEIMETILGVPIKMIVGSQLPFIFSKRIDTVSSTPRFLNYATSLGILYEAMALSKEKEVFSPSYPKSLIAKTISRFKEIYQEYF